MADNKEIRVRIDAQIVDSDKPYESSGVDSKKQEASKRSFGVSKAIAVNMVSKGAQYAMSNYGNITGDYVTQSNINSMIETGGLIAMAATGPAGLIASGITVGVKILDYSFDMRKKQADVDFLRQRVGMTNGRSR